MIESGEIEVSKKTLLHISEGIYRTEGSSIKELISNAFDAMATRVIINTNYPTFDVLTCRDNGEGMSEKEFLRIVKGGIGDSLKTMKQSISERPIIGKLGIGILAMAQICRSFTIISHDEKSKTAFKGQMIFKTDVENEKKKKILMGENSNQKYGIGHWKLEENPKFEYSKKGVFIFTDDLRQSYIRRFRESDVIKNAQKNDAPLDFKSLLDIFYINNFRSVKQLGPYYDLIWELCQLSPLPYYEETPFRDKLKNLTAYKFADGKEFTNAKDFIFSKQKELCDYNFNVVFDDIKLYRTTKLPSPEYRGDKQQDCQLFYYEYDNLVRKKKLKFQTYVFSQETAVMPRDLKGMQIRIKNVGIGLSDSTFLKYDKIESPRDNWISGEIYIEEGLESALNIDRDSFNENDEQYYILKKKVHDFLSSQVFPTIASLQRKRNKKKRELQEEEKTNKMKARLKHFFKIELSIELEFSSLLYSAVELDLENKKILFPVSILNSTFNKRRDFFSDLIVQLLPLLQNKYKENSILIHKINILSSIILI